MSRYEIIIIYNGNWFATSASEIQTAVADLYEYVGGKISAQTFRTIAMKLTGKEAVALYGELALEVPINSIYTGCRMEQIRDVGLVEGMEAV